MKIEALQDFLQRQHAHAAVTRGLDEELGTHHGLAWSDFVLLDLVDGAGGTMSTQELASRLGVLRSRFVIQLLPLEKTGLLARAVAEDGTRRVVLRSSGRRLLREARETAEAVCREAART